MNHCELGFADVGVKTRCHSSEDSRSETRALRAGGRYDGHAKDIGLNLQPHRAASTAPRRYDLMHRACAGKVRSGGITCFVFKSWADEKRRKEP